MGYSYIHSFSRVLLKWYKQENNKMAVLKHGTITRRKSRLILWMHERHSTMLKF